MWGTNIGLLSYWRYDLYDDVDKSIEIHAMPMQNSFYMYPSDWRHTYLPLS
jgi:hypothetical protein